MSAEKHPCFEAVFHSDRRRSFSVIGHTFQAGLVGVWQPPTWRRVKDDGATERWEGGHGRGMGAQQHPTGCGESKTLVPGWAGEPGTTGGCGMDQVWSRFGSDLALQR